MRRVLMVAYYFPPLGGIGSLRALKFASYLPDFGWQPTVLAPRNGAYYRDPTLVFPEERVIRTHSLELSRAGKRLVMSRAGDTVPAPVGRATRRIRDLVRQYVYRPDPQVGWYPFAVQAGRAALRESRFDAILSSSFPVTAHLVARRLHRDSGVPWVAEFRDPWTDQVEAASPGRAWRERLERALLARARSVIVPSPAWAELFRRKGTRNVAVITNGYDPCDLPPADPVVGFVLTHVGSLYPGRQNFSTLWLALAALMGAGAIEEVKLQFVGDMHPRVLDDIRTRGLADNVDVTGFLPYRRALAAMNASTALLLAGTRDDRDFLQGWIPAKVFEYLATGLPVIYVGDPRADVATLLANQPNCHVLAPGDVDAARRAFIAAMGEGRVRRDLKGFSRRELTAQLGAVLDGVVP